MSGGRVRGVAVGCALVLSIPLAAGASAPPDPVEPPSSLAGEVPPTSKLAKHVIGKVQIAQGLRVTRAPVRVETLMGKKLAMPRKIVTSVGGGVFFPAKDLPTRFVVVIDGSDRKKSKGRGHLRAFVDRRDKGAVQISFGTTAAVRTYRLAKGKWSIRKAEKRTVRALKLPDYTQLGFDDRVNPVYVSRKVLMEKSGGKLDPFSRKVAKAAYKGKKSVPIYAGRGPLGVTKNVGTLLHPRTSKRSSSAAGITTSVVTKALQQVFIYASLVYQDIANVQAGNQLTTALNDMTALNDEMDQLNEQVSYISTSLNNGFNQVYDQLAQNNYNTLVADWNYPIAQVWSMFEALQTTPCPSYANCSANNVSVSSYGYAVCFSFGGLGVDDQPAASATCTEPYGGEYPNSSAPGLLNNVGSMGGQVFDMAGAEGLITSAWSMIEAYTATGDNELTQNWNYSPPANIPFTGLNQPISETGVQASNYWYSQLEQVLVMGVNFQKGQWADPALNSGALFPLVYNLEQAYPLLPTALPEGTVYDPSTELLWGQMGQTMLNANAQSGATSLPTGVTVSGTEVDFGSTFAGLTGSVTPANVAQNDAFSWQIPQVTSWTAGGSVTGTWVTSPQLGSTNGSATSGLLTQFPQTTSPSALWTNVASLPTSPTYTLVTNKQTNKSTVEKTPFSTFLMGLAGANEYFTASGAPLWAAWSPAGESSPSSWDFSPLSGQNLVTTASGYNVGQYPTSTPNLLLYSALPNGYTAQWQGYKPKESPPSTPSPPRNVTATNSGTAGSGAVTVSWDVPAWTPTQLTSYTATAVGGEGSGVCTSVPPSSGGSAPKTCTISGLVPGAYYSVAVLATNAAGSSNPSASASVTVAKAPASASVTEAKS